MVPGGTHAGNEPLWLEEKEEEEEEEEEERKRGGEGVFIIFLVAEGQEGTRTPRLGRDSKHKEGWPTVLNEGSTIVNYYYNYAYS
jgi:hypothetical protein